MKRLLTIALAYLIIISTGCDSTEERNSHQLDVSKNDTSEPDTRDTDASVSVLPSVDEWETSAPEAQGVDSTKLAEVIRTITGNDIKTHSIFVARNGFAILDAVFYPFSFSEGLHDFASVTKAIIATLIGIAIDKGFVQSVDQKVLDFFPDRSVENRNDRKEEITIEDLLTMRSGFQCGHDGEKELWEMTHHSDKPWVQYALDFPMDAKPGTQFAYCSPNTHLLSAILTEITGMTALEFAQKYLFGPLGIEDIIWNPDPQGITRGWGDMFLRPADMAKIGYLYLNNGLWNGERIVSSNWLQNSLQQHSSTTDTEGYGYHWMSDQAFPGVYYAKGMGGQRLIIWPEKAVVVVLNSGREDVDAFTALLAVSLTPDSALPENPEAFADLQTEIERIRQAPVPKKVPVLPEIAHSISGRTYVLEDNYPRVSSISLSFDSKNEASLFVSVTGLEFVGSLPVGLDDVYRIVPGLYQGTPMGIKGFWTPQEEFIIFTTAISSYYSLKWIARFTADEVTLDLYEETGLFKQSITGAVSTAP